MWLEVVVVVTAGMAGVVVILAWVDWRMNLMEGRLLAKFESSGVSVPKPGAYVMDEVEQAEVERAARETSRQRGVAAGWRRYSVR